MSHADPTQLSKTYRQSEVSSSDNVGSECEPVYTVNLINIAEPERDQCAP